MIRTLLINVAVQILFYFFLSLFFLFSQTQLIMAHSLTIIHYNDIYNVEPNPSREPVGGAARFLTAVKSFQHLNPLILFSGDAFSPSMRTYHDLSYDVCN